MTKVATELMRDFFKVLGPKVPNHFKNYSVVLESTDKDRYYYVYKFKLPESLKEELMISNKMLPMFASSMENLLLSKMVAKGVDGELNEMIDFIHSLPKFKKTIDTYFKGQDINTVFEFE